MKNKSARSTNRQDVLAPMPVVAEPALAEMALRFIDDNMGRRLQAGQALRSAPAASPVRLAQP